jgi:hypothetical protein
MDDKKIAEEEGVYIYETEDPKQKFNELSVTFYFPIGSKLQGAIGKVLGELVNCTDIEYSIDMWTKLEDE